MTAKINATNAGRNPDANLWCAVISQAIDDATMPLVQARTNLIRKQARNWFTSDSRDFREVCASAGLDSGAVRAFALKGIAEADQREAADQRQPRSVQRPAPKASSRRNAVSRTLITFGQETLSLDQWSKRTGINPYTIETRLSRGWPVERALTEQSRRRSSPSIDHMAA